jgi:uncharacterized cupin superfamily protein
VDIARHPGNSANTVVDPARARKPSPRPAAWTRARAAHYDPRRLRAEGETDMDGSGIIPSDAVRFDPGVELEIWEEMPASTLVSSRPVQRGRLFIDDPARGLTAGIWACSAFVSTMAPHDNDEFMLLLEGAVEIAEPSGKVTRIVAGESFILPKGLVRQWRQTGDVKKIFVILETPDDAAARDTRGLAVLKPDPAVALSPSAGPKPEMLLSGSPRQCGHEIFEDRDGRLTVGVWSSTAYHRKPMPFPRHELMCLLEGSVAITGPSGRTQTFTAGESFFVPYGALTDFRTDGDVRKIYVTLDC